MHESIMFFLHFIGLVWFALKQIKEYRFNLANTVSRKNCV